jgi:hypothetical protein
MKPRLTNEEKVIIALIKKKEDAKKLTELVGISTLSYPSNKKEVKLFSKAFGTSFSFWIIYDIFVSRNLKELKKLAKKLEKREDLENLNLVKKEIEEIESFNQRVKKLKEGER